MEKPMNMEMVETIIPADDCDGNNDKEAGFTLVEVMVTMMIIGLLIAVVAFNVGPMQDKARLEKARADISKISQALEMYNLQLNDYPEEAAGLQALREPVDTRTEALYPKGGFIAALPNDPWGRPYQYKYPGDNNVFDVFSFGADGELGGEGKAADIVSWQE